MPVSSEHSVKKKKDTRSATGPTMLIREKQREKKIWKKKDTHGRLYSEVVTVGPTAIDGWYDDVGWTPTRRLVRMVNHVLRLRRECS